jgi:hypothetical protein
MPTVKELRQKCKQMGIKGYSKMKKSELLKVCNDKKSVSIKKSPNKKSIKKFNLTIESGPSIKMSPKKKRYLTIESGPSIKMSPKKNELYISPKKAYSKDKLSEFDEDVIKQLTTQEKERIRKYLIYKLLKKSINDPLFKNKSLEDVILYSRQNLKNFKNVLKHKGERIQDDDDTLVHFNDYKNLSESDLRPYLIAIYINDLREHNPELSQDFNIIYKSYMKNYKENLLSTFSRRNPNHIDEVLTYINKGEEKKLKTMLINKFGGTYGKERFGNRPLRDIILESQSPEINRYGNDWDSLINMRIKKYLKAIVFSIYIQQLYNSFVDKQKYMSLYQYYIDNIRKSNKPLLIKPILPTPKKKINKNKNRKN